MSLWTTVKNLRDVIFADGSDNRVDSTRQSFNAASPSSINVRRKAEYIRIKTHNSDRCGRDG